MTTNESNKVTLEFTSQSMNDLVELAKQLNTNPQGVIGQALALLRVAQGRKVILKDKSKSLEIDKYSNQPAQVMENK